MIQFLNTLLRYKPNVVITVSKETTFSPFDSALASLKSLSLFFV